MSVVGGFSIIEVPSREEALAWAGRIAMLPRGSRDHVRPKVLNGVMRQRRSNGLCEA